MIQLRLILALSLALAAAFPAFAKTEKAAEKSKVKAKVDASQEVANVLKAYRLAGGIHAKVQKIVTSTLMGTEMKSEGEFYFSKGKLRLEIREPDHSLLVFDGKTIWFETPMDDDHVQVTKMRTSQLRKDSIVTALFERKDVLKAYKLKSAKAVDGKKVYAFAAKDKESEVPLLELTLKDKDIERIVYKDKLENRVSLEFSDLKKGPVRPEKFAYTPPKKAEVMEP